MDYMLQKRCFGLLGKHKNCFSILKGMERSCKEIIMVLGGIFVLILFTQQVKAQNFESEFYKVESGSFIFQPEIKQNSGNYDLAGSFDSDSKQRFQKNGYLVAPNKVVFRALSSNSRLNFEDVKINDESAMTSTISLNTSAKSNFTASIHLAEAFSNGVGGVILPTICDSLKNPCSPIRSGSWEKAPGFGYRVGGTEGYRSFYISPSGEKAAILISNIVDDKDKKIPIEFRLRMPSNMADGIYKSTVVISTSIDY